MKITLDRYGRLMPNSEEEAAARLDAYLARASCAPVLASAEPTTADESGDGEAAPSRFELLYYTGPREQPGPMLRERRGLKRLELIERLGVMAEPNS